jgi:hypothetical protein
MAKDRSRPWRVIAVLGFWLIVLTLADLFLEFVGIANASLSNALPFTLLAGAVLCFVGGIGWARHLGRAVRISFASAASVVLGAAFLIVGTNVHGPGILVGLLFAVALLLLVVILFLPAKKEE